MSDDGARVSWLMLGAATAAVGVEAASNALFAYDLGAWRVDVRGVPVAIDGALLATASVATAVMQAHSATAIIRDGQPAMSATGALLALGLALSAGSMSAHMLALQQKQHDKVAAIVAHHEGAAAAQRTARDTYDRAVAEDARQRARLATLPEASRPLDALEAEIAAFRLSSGVWNVTRQCSALLNVPDYAKACQPLLDLRAARDMAAQRATAARDASAAAGALAAAKADLEAKDQALAAAPKPEAPWPVRTFLAQLLPWLMAIAILACSTVGFALATRRPRRVLVDTQPDTQPPPATPKGPRPVRPSTLGALLQDLSAGAVTVPGCSVDADGWIDASQRVLAGVLKSSPSTVSRQMADLRNQKLIATKKDNGRELIKCLN